MNCPSLTINNTLYNALLVAIKPENDHVMEFRLKRYRSFDGIINDTGSIVKNIVNAKSPSLRDLSLFQILYMKHTH